MRKKVVWGFLLVALASISFGNTSVSKTASFSDPEPHVLVAVKK